MSILHPIFVRVLRKVSDLSGPEKRLSAQALWGAFRRRALDRHGAIALSLAKVGQFFGLAFTAGVLLFSWTDSMFYSRVFGWQSTHFSVTPEAAYRIIRITSGPWAWLAGEGRVSLACNKSPPPVLCATRIRAVFPEARFGLGELFNRGCARLWLSSRERSSIICLGANCVRRSSTLTSPKPASTGSGSGSPSPQVSVQTPHGGVAPALPAFARTPPEPGVGEVKSILILPEELNSPARREAIVQWLASEKQWTAEERCSLTTEPGGIDAALKEMARAHQERAVSRAVLVQESFMPPVKSVLKASHFRFERPWARTGSLSACSANHPTTRSASRLLRPISRFGRRKS